MVTKYKVKFSEKDGIEQDFESEIAMSAENAFYNDTLTIKEKIDGITSGIQQIRFVLNLILNGTVSNNQWISYTELTPNVYILFPYATEITEITWANINSNTSFDIEIYKNGTTNLIKTLSVRNAGDIYGTFEAVNISLAAGDYIRLKYIDQGTNLSDAVIQLWCKRTLNV